jgi:hypothetical protein
MNRRLTLKTEHLSELTASELVTVGGAGVTTACTGYYTTIDAPCATIRPRDITTILH